MKTELQQLREEIAKLRERVAVLEARPQAGLGVYPHPAPQPVWTSPPVQTFGPITCGGTARQSGVL